MTPGINTTQRVAPFLYFDDVATSIDWLRNAFGCTERFRLEGPGGVVHHAEVAFGDGVVMVGNVGPRNSGPLPATVRSGVYVFVDDVDAHCASARSAGAEIVSEPTDLPFGDRLYVVRDNEGHEGYFAQHMRDVPSSTSARSPARVQPAERRGVPVPGGCLVLALNTQSGQ